MDIQSLLTSDQQLLLAMNGSDSLFLDQLALILTSAWTWVPLYASLLYLVVKNNEKISFRKREIEEAREKNSSDDDRTGSGSSSRRP